MLYTVWSILL